MDGTVDRLYGRKPDPPTWNRVNAATQGHNQRENKTLIRYYQRAYDEGEEETAVRVSVNEQIGRARAVYSGKPLERALKQAASA